MIEREKTYLVKFLPENFDSFPHKEMLDIYLPPNSHHPKIRLRKQGDKLYLMKKTLINGDMSTQKEEVILLDQEEFDYFSQLEGKRIHKNRYYIPYQDKTIELDVFLDDLAGLVLADVEFTSEEEKEVFQIPDFCLADITKELRIA